MAQNYTFKEAVAIIVENKDQESLVELSKRFPLLTSRITRVVTKAAEEFSDLAQYMPDNLSANKVNQTMKRALFGDAADSMEDEPQVVKGRRPEPKILVEVDENTEYDYDNMTNAQMYKLLGEMGKRKDCQEKFGSMSHDAMQKYLKKYGPGSNKAAEVEDDVEDDAAEDEVVSYEGKSAVELYKLCKSRKLKVEPKKPAKYYISILEKDDEEQQNAAADEDDEDWDDEDEVDVIPNPAPAPKKPVKEAPVKTTTGKRGRPPKAAPVKPVAKSKASDGDDDEDWDI